MKVTCWESGAGGHSEGESPGVAMLPNYQLSINICLSHYNCYGPSPASLLPAHHHYNSVSRQHFELNHFI